MANHLGDMHYSPNQSHMLAPRESVTVFWDYENCPCPMSTKIATLTYDIKRRIDHFLGKKLNKRIQLYCPMQRLHQKTREDSTDLGILMMDVASKRKQESVDKRIIADIGLFAAELAESKGNDIGHIVLISGDSDYGYILARLRDKAYIGKIIIFINDYTKETLIQHADHTHCLFQSNLTRKENPFSDYNQRKLPTYGHSSQYSPYTHHSSMQSRTRPHTAEHFQLNGGGYNNHSHSHSYQVNEQPLSSQWTTTYFPYQNTSNAMDDMYSNGHRSKPESLRNKAPRSDRRGYHNVNGSNLNNGGGPTTHTLKPNKPSRNNTRDVRQPLSPESYAIKHILSRDMMKQSVVSREVVKPESKTAPKSSSYVYRRKEKEMNHKHNGEMNGHTSDTAHVKAEDTDIINAPPPIPPKPQSLAPSKSNGSSASSTASTKTNGSHRIVSQENLEEQLKQQQKEKEKEKEKEEKEKEKEEKEKLAINGSDSPHIDVYACSAEIDGVRDNINGVSTFSVGSLYRINEVDDESKAKAKSKHMKNGLADDFFDTMIAPKEDDMDRLLKDIAPNVNVLGQDDGARVPLPPKTDHIIDLQAIKMRSPSAPKKILVKKKSKSSSGGHHHHHHHHNNTSLIPEQLRLVWDALCYCQKNGNNTPRRREIYKAMKKTHAEYMKEKDMKYADECIDACLSYGTVEEMIKGRISSLYILPVILNALTSPDSTFYYPSKEGASHVWITLDALKNHLKSRYTNHLSTYFTLTYLYRIISNATRLFAFHKDDKNKSDSDLNDEELKLIRFRVRKNAYYNNNNSSNQHNNNNTHASVAKSSYYPNNNNNNNHNNNLSFKYYS